MKIVLASYFEQENHGSGRKIGISPGKPHNLPYECDLVFDDFSPGDIYWDYQKNKKNDYKAAGENFVNDYTNQLDLIFKQIKEQMESSGKSAQEILPFEDGDTLLSWEKKSSMTYRAILAPYLKELGYDVQEN